MLLGMERAVLLAGCGLIWEGEGNTRGWQREGWGRVVMGRGGDELGRKGGAERDEGGIEERKIYRICANI